MRVIATVLSCAALLSCSAESDSPRSPLLAEVVRAPDVVWSTDTFDCRQIASEDNRLDALSRANELERHRLVRARNIQLVQWVIPYYGWVATARAAMLDDDVKKIDLVIQDAGDRRQELQQFSLAANCAGASAKIFDTTAFAPVNPVPTATPGQPDALPAIQHEDPPPRLARPAGAPPALKTSTAPAAAARPAAIAAPAAGTRAAARSETGTRVEGGSVILPLGPRADVDRAAADITAALQPR